MGERREGEGEGATRGPASAPPLAAGAAGGGRRGRAGGLLRWVGGVAPEPPWGATRGRGAFFRIRVAFLGYELSLFCVM